MPGYRFYSAADRRQDEIWDYTVERWGTEQAESYIRGLHDELQLAAEKKTIWRTLPRDKFGNNWPDIYYIRYRLHHIFFRMLSNDVIGIVSILHSAMDMPQQLQDDLDQ